LDRGTLEPIAPERHVLRLVVDREFADDLQRLKGLLSHSLPGGNITEVIHMAIRRTIAACEKQRRGSDRPRPRKTPSANGPAPTTAVKREVWTRDEACCAYVSPDGKRCRSTFQLEFHHIHPAGKGGPPTVDNISVRCKPHNAYAAELDYGREFMTSARSRSGKVP
jgi:hypothetical protein